MSGRMVVGKIILLMVLRLPVLVLIFLPLRRMPFGVRWRSMGCQVVSLPSLHAGSGSAPDCAACGILGCDLGSAGFLAWSFGY